MESTIDFNVLIERDTWKAFVISIVLFCVIGYSSLTLFDLSTSIYGTSDEINEVPDFIVPTMNRTGIDDLADFDEDGSIKMSELRGYTVVLDFMAIDCSNCHLVQKHIEQNLDREAIKEYVPMHPADTHKTWSDTSKIRQLGYSPKTPIGRGVYEFVQWYKDYYHVN